AAWAIPVARGPPLAPGDLGGLDHYLTARWQLYTTLGPVLARSTVEHEPWPLHRAVVRELDGNPLTRDGPRARAPAPCPGRCSPASTPTCPPRPDSPPRPGSRWSTGRRGCGPGSAGRG